MKISTVVLAVIAVVFIITTGIFASLYYSQAATLSSDNSRLSSYSATLSADNTKMSQLSVDLSNYSDAAALDLAMSNLNDMVMDNTSLLIQGYAPNAVLDWNGGSISGNYSGYQQISSFWNNFTSTYRSIYEHTEVTPTVTQINSSYYSVRLNFMLLVNQSGSNQTMRAYNVTDTLLIKSSLGSSPSALNLHNIAQLKDIYNNKEFGADSIIVQNFKIAPFSFYTATILPSGYVLNLYPDQYYATSFTIPSNVFSASVTGSYTSTYAAKATTNTPVGVAILTPDQYAKFTQAPYAYISYAQFYSGNGGATINTSLPPGTYYLVIFNFNHIPDTITVVNAITLSTDYPAF